MKLHLLFLAFICVSQWGCKDKKVEAHDLKADNNPGDNYVCEMLPDTMMQRINDYADSHGMLAVYSNFSLQLTLQIDHELNTSPTVYKKTSLDSIALKTYCSVMGVRKPSLARKLIRVFEFIVNVYPDKSNYEISYSYFSDTDPLFRNVRSYSKK